MFRRLAEASSEVTISIDGRPFRAASGDMLSTALLLAGVASFRRTPRTGLDRGPYCGMGVCFDCLVTIDGAANRQACLVRVTEGMKVETGGRLPVVGRSDPA